MAALPQFRSVRDHVMIRGFSARVSGLSILTHVRDVVSSLRFDHLDPAGREITDIGNHQRRNPNISVRLDRQANTSAGAGNLQIQVNDVALRNVRLNQTEGTTVAQVIVPAAIYREVSACHENNLRAHLENVVRSALLSSFDSAGSQFTIEDS